MYYPGKRNYNYEEEKFEENLIKLRLSSVLKDNYKNVKIALASWHYNLFRLCVKTNKYIP